MQIMQCSSIEVLKLVMDSLAVKYSKTSIHQQQDGHRLISKMPNLKEGMKVLDLGCGTGYLSSVIAKLVGPTGSVLGIDPDEERIDLARETYGDSISNVSFMVASASDFPYEDGQYDVVFSNYVLHWVSDKENAFKRVYESLKSGGVFGFIACLCDNEYFQQIYDLIVKNGNKDPRNALHHEPFSFYEKSLPANKFTVLSKEAPRVTYKFKNVEEFLVYYHASSGRVFDPGLAGERDLERFKQQFADDAVQLELYTIVEMVCQK